MTTLTQTQPDAKVTVGVDTHLDNHVAAALDHQGRHLDTQTFTADPDGYQALIEWARQFGPVHQAGIEGTGCYGAGLATAIKHAGIECIEVNRVNRQQRRRNGKTDQTDALAAARAVQSGEATATPRGRDGAISGLRTNRIAYRSAIRARTQAINQIRAMITTAPEPLRSNLKNLDPKTLIAVAARYRPNGIDEYNTTKHALKSLARRVQHLTTEIDDLKHQRQQLVEHSAPPELLAEQGIGADVAASILIAFGSNPDRIQTEAAFASLCGASPIDASSGRQQRHRLNRGGDRQANNALWRIVMVRMVHDPQTRAYINRQTANGKTKREAIRNLKRYIARHIYKILTTHQTTLDTP